MFTQKLMLVVAATVCTPTLFALAQTASTTTTTPVPVNLNQNIVTTVLILGVVIGVTLIYALAKLIPKCRRGEVSLSKIDFDWRAELLNQTSKKEKARRAAEKARREEEAVAGRYGDVDESGMHNHSDTQPRVEMKESEEPISAYSGRNEHDDGDANVTFPRQNREE